MLNTQHASLVNLHATLLQLLHINNCNSEGHVMMPLFKNHQGFTKRKTPRAPEARL